MVIGHGQLNWVIGNCQQSTVNRQPSTVNRQPSTANCQLPTD
ncbi:hypothetical protein [Microcoleus sp. Pol11C3]